MKGGTMERNDLVILKGIRAAWNLKVSPHSLAKWGHKTNQRRLNGQSTDNNNPREKPGKSFASQARAEIIMNLQRTQLSLGKLIEKSFETFTQITPK